MTDYLDIRMRKCHEHTTSLILECLQVFDLKSVSSPHMHSSAIVNPSIDTIETFPDILRTFHISSNQRRKTKDSFESSSRLNLHYSISEAFNKISSTHSHFPMPSKKINPKIVYRAEEEEE